jgi:hypothetical protein
MLLLRDGSVLMSGAGAGPWELLHPLSGSYRTFRSTYTQASPEPIFWDAGGVVTSSGEVVVAGLSSAGESHVWRRDPIWGQWTVISAAPPGVIDPRLWAPPPGAVDPATEMLCGPGGQLIDGRLHFAVVTKDGHFPMALATVTNSGSWQRFPLPYRVPTNAHGWPGVGDYAPGFIGPHVTLPGAHGHVLTVVNLGAEIDVQAVEFAPEDLAGPWTTRLPIGGPEILAVGLPSGDVFVFGSKGYLYTPGTMEPWLGFGALPAGAPMDHFDGVSAAVLLPSGRILFASRPTAQPAMSLYEFDPEARVLFGNDPLPGYGDVNLLLLPSGEVFVSTSDGHLFLYEPDPVPPRDEWRPVIDACPTAADSGQIIEISGRRFGGVAHAVSRVGENSANQATNYPLVRVTAAVDGAVSYWRTTSTHVHAIGDESDDSFLAFVPNVAVDTHFRLVVVVNGIESRPVDITVTAASGGPPARFAETELGQKLFGNLADGELFVFTGHGVRRVPGWDTGQREEVAALNQDLRRIADRLYTLGQQSPRKRPR